MQLVFFIRLQRSLISHHHLDEGAHDYRENGAAEDLNYRTGHFLRYAHWMHIAVADGRQRRQHEIETADQLLLNSKLRVVNIEVLFATGPPQLVLDNPVPLIWLLRKLYVTRKCGQQVVAHPIPEEAEDTGGCDQLHDLVDCLDDYRDLPFLGDALVPRVRLIAGYHHLGDVLFGD